MPDAVSTNQLLHFGQNLKSKHFRQFDYGRMKNYAKYKRSSPPDYNLKNIKIPIAVYYAENDPVINGDYTVPMMLKNLPTIVKTYLVPHKLFNHYDFLWANDGAALIYNEILKTMKSV